MKSTPARVAGSILTKSMRVRTLSLSRTKYFLHICIRGRVGLSSTTSHEGVGFKPQSLRRRGFEPHRMHTRRETDWRNGSASDSSPEGYEFESRIGQLPGTPRPLPQARARSRTSSRARCSRCSARRSPSAARSTARRRWTSWRRSSRATSRSRTSRL